MLRYAYFDMIQDIGLRLAIGLLIAALIQVSVPDEFFLTFGSQPLLQMLVILVVAVPMYICPTGAIAFTDPEYLSHVEMIEHAFAEPKRPEFFL